MPRCAARRPAARPRSWSWTATARAATDFNSLVPELLDPDCEYVVQEQWTEYTGFLEEGADARFRRHARDGRYGRRRHEPHGLGAHWQNLWFNGTQVGETGINAALCGTWGCPVLLVTGDEAACREGKALLGDGLTTVAVKAGSDRSARMLPPERARELEAGAETAVSNLGRRRALRTGEAVRDPGRVQVDRPGRSSGSGRGSRSSTRARSSRAATTGGPPGGSSTSRADGARARAGGDGLLVGGGPGLRLGGRDLGSLAAGLVAKSASRSEGWTGAEGRARRRTSCATGCSRWPTATPRLRAGADGPRAARRRAWQGAGEAAEVPLAMRGTAGDVAELAAEAAERADGPPVRRLRRAALAAGAARAASKLVAVNLAAAEGDERVGRAGRAAEAAAEAAGARFREADVGYGEGAPGSLVGNRSMAAPTTSLPRLAGRDPRRGGVLRAPARPRRPEARPAGDAARPADRARRPTRPRSASAIAALVKGEPAVGAGVVLGSNVFNLAAMVGFSAVLCGWDPDPARGARRSRAPSRCGHDRRRRMILRLIGAWAALGCSRWCSSRTSSLLALGPARAPRR